MSLVQIKKLFENRLRPSYLFSQVMNYILCIVRCKSMIKGMKFSIDLTAGTTGNEIEVIQFIYIIPLA